METVLDFYRSVGTRYGTDIANLFMDELHQWDASYDSGTFFSTSTLEMLLQNALERAEQCEFV